MTAALAGVRVVAQAALGPIPLATMLLADLGADVIRIDRADLAGEVTGLAMADDPRTRGHRAIGLDLKTDDGLELARRLVDSADVFLDGMRPGVAERIGLGPDELRSRNRRLIYARMTGWGQTGPLAQRAGHDINYLAISGALHPIGPADRPPTVPINYVADFGGGGAFLVIGILAALHARTATGEGQVIDCAMVDGAASISAMLHGMLASGAWVDERGANLFDGAAPFYNTYRTADDRFVAVGALEPQFYAQLLKGLELDSADWPQNDRGRWPAQRAAFAEIFAGRTRDEWRAVFDDVDACVSPVLSLREAALEPTLRERDTFVDWYGLTQPGPAPRLSQQPDREPPRRTPRFAHTDELLAGLGCTADDISQLRGRHIVA